MHIAINPFDQEVRCISWEFDAALMSLLLQHDDLLLFSERIEMVNFSPAQTGGKIGKLRLQSSRRLVGAD